MVKIVFHVQTRKCLTFKIVIRVMWDKNESLMRHPQVTPKIQHLILNFTFFFHCQTSTLLFTSMGTSVALVLSIYDSDNADKDCVHGDDDNDSKKKKNNISNCNNRHRL